jgi:hypothetical protein
VHYFDARNTITTCQHITSLYIHYIYTWYQSVHQPMYNYKGLCIRDTTIPSPLFMHCPQCIIYTCTYKISKLFKNMRILCSHKILTLPGCIIKIILGTLDLYHLHDSIPKLLGFLIQYVNQSNLKSSFWLHLNHIPINDMISIRYTLLKQ